MSLGTILAFLQGLCALVEGLRFSHIPKSQFSPVDGEYSNSISLYPRNYCVHSTISGTIRYSEFTDIFFTKERCNFSRHHNFITVFLADMDRGMKKTTFHLLCDNVKTEACNHRTISILSYTKIRCST